MARIEIQEVILTYPLDPFMLAGLEADADNVRKLYGVGCVADKEKRTLTITTTPDEIRLEKLFPPDMDDYHLKRGVKVEFHYCPSGTTTVVVTFPEKGWEDRDPQILRSVYHADGYKTEILTGERKLVLKPRTANLNNLPFERFEQQGCVIEFIK